MGKRYGAVIVFREGATLTECEAALDAIVEHTDPEYRDARVEKFDPEFGGPVWYVP